jgi:hypothetical protein
MFEDPIKGKQSPFKLVDFMGILVIRLLLSWMLILDMIIWSPFTWIFINDFVIHL